VPVGVFDSVLVLVLGTSVLLVFFLHVWNGPFAKLLLTGFALLQGSSP